MEINHPNITVVDGADSDLKCHLLEVNTKEDLVEVLKVGFWVVSEFGSTICMLDKDDKKPGPKHCEQILAALRLQDPTFFALDYIPIEKALIIVTVLQNNNIKPTDMN